MESRYSRNELLVGIGPDGQQRLLKGRVLIVGCGALGSVVAMYLAASGVGHIVLVDYDEIGLSNLQRQLSFTIADVGRHKAIVLTERLRAINPEVNVVALCERLTANHLNELIDTGVDLVIEGSDNSSTKHMVARECANRRIPCIIGGVAQWQGQLFTQLPGGPTYADIFPTEGPEGSYLPASVGGVLGPLPGIIGSLQATQAIKLLVTTTPTDHIDSTSLLTIDTRTLAINTISLS